MSGVFLANHLDLLEGSTDNAATKRPT